MRLSIHPDIVGKPVKTETGYYCNGKRVNLGYGWLNIETDNWHEAFELITTDGYATSAELKSDHRNDDNYLSRQICMVDIDDGMTIQQLFDNDFYNEFGSGFYTTARHTDEHHRFRIIFLLEQPETDPMRMRKIIRGLLTMFSSGDTSCKDASRIYYGVKDCIIKECRDKYLPNFICDALIEMIDSEDSKYKSYAYQQINTTYDEIFVDKLLTKIRQQVGNLRGDYNAWLTIAWAVCHTVGIHNAKALMTRHWPEKTKKEMKSLESYNDRHKSPTLGTLIKLSNISKTERQLLELEMKLRNIK